VSWLGPCGVTREALTDIEPPRIKATLRQGSTESGHKNEGHTAEPKNRWKPVIMIMISRFW
jgi:hypothetical protein